MTRGGDQKDLEDGQPLGLDHVVDVGALGREHERAAHGAEALHRHGDRDDDVAALVDAHHAGVLAVQGLGHFGIALAVLRAEFVIERKIAAPEPGAQPR